MVTWSLDLGLDRKGYPWKLISKREESVSRIWEIVRGGRSNKSYSLFYAKEFKYSSKTGALGWLSLGDSASYAFDSFFFF